jgi:hypothetical protein
VYWGDTYSDWPSTSQDLALLTSIRVQNVEVNTVKALFFNSSATTVYHGGQAVIDIAFPISARYD